MRDCCLPGTESILGLVTHWPDPDDVERRARYRTSVERESVERAGSKFIRRRFSGNKS